MDNNDTEIEEQRQRVLDENRRLSNESEYTEDENRRLSNECKKWKRIVILKVLKHEKTRFCECTPRQPEIQIRFRGRGAKKARFFWASSQLGKSFAEN